MGKIRSDNAVEILKNVGAGALGGLVASFAMNQFQMILKKVSEKEQSSSGDSADDSGDDATVKTADAISKTVTGEELIQPHKKPAGAAVHYIYGTSLGAAYGLLGGLTPKIMAGRGTLYGTGTWVAGDEIGVPAFGLSKPPSEIPLSSHVSALAAHLIFGVVTDGIVRLIRK